MNQSIYFNLNNNQLAQLPWPGSVSEQWHHSKGGNGGVCHPPWVALFGGSKIEVIPRPKNKNREDLKKVAKKIGVGIKNNLGG